MTTIDNYLDNHYIHRSNWLRAAVLGANDGIISISSLAIGIAAASSTREPIVLATIAGLVAGAGAAALALARQRFRPDHVAQPGDRRRMVAGRSEHD